MNGHTMTATRLRLVLSVALFAIVAIGVGIFSLAESQLKKVAIDVSHSVVDANASRDKLQSLQKIQQELAAQQAVVLRAGKVAANSQSYQYQNQIINDLNRYAKRAHITLTNIDFATDVSTKSTTATKPGATAAPVPSGVKPATISVTIKSPVNYQNLLQFMRSLEQNLTKMQVSSISLSKGDGGVSSDALTIQVYVK